MITHDCNQRADGREELRSHYGFMLGLRRAWKVEIEKLDVVGMQLELRLLWQQ
jgi:hypothetical protein